MNNKLNKILHYPLLLFRNKFVIRWFVLRVTILISFLLLTANIIYDFSPENIWVKFHNIFYLLKDSLFQILTISSLGYVLSKTSFCNATLISFYAILLSKLTWFIDKYIWEFSPLVTKIDGVVNILIILIIGYHLKKQYKR